MLIALVQSPVYALLLKIANEDRQDCLELMASQKDKDEILRLQGRALGCTYIKNAPKMLAQFQVELETKRAEGAAKAAKKPKS